MAGLPLNQPHTRARKRKPYGHAAHGYGKPSQAGHWFEVKTIKGHYYLYECWREGRDKRSVYRGKAIKHNLQSSEASPTPS